MYSWQSRPDCDAVDEPLYAHHLQKRPDLFRPYRDELLQAQNPDGEVVLAQLRSGQRPGSNSDSSGVGLLFAKHLAKQIVDLDVRQTACGPTQRHVVLIRHPFKQLLSFAAKQKSAAHAETSLDELALPQLLDIFGRLSGTKDANPVVVDYDDLLANPQGILTSLCRQLGIPFEPAMLKWEPGPKSCDGLWAKHW